MRNDLRRRLAALTAAVFAVALLSGNVAGAQPAASGGQGARPAAQAAGAPLSPEVIGAALAPGPNACPRLHRTSQSTPNTPNSCGPPPTTAPPAPTCDLSIGDPYLAYDSITKKVRIYTNGGIHCSRVVNITLTVELYKQLSPNAIQVDIRQLAGIGEGAHLSAWTVCADGTYYGRVRATITYGVNKSKSFGPLVGGEALVRCS